MTLIASWAAWTRHCLSADSTTCCWCSRITIPTRPGPQEAVNIHLCQPACVSTGLFNTDVCYGSVTNHMSPCTLALVQISVFFNTIFLCEICRRETTVQHHPKSHVLKMAGSTDGNLIPPEADLINQGLWNLYSEIHTTSNNRTYRLTDLLDLCWVELRLDTFAAYSNWWKVGCVVKNMPKDSSGIFHRLTFASGMSCVSCTNKLPQPYLSTMHVHHALWLT